MEEEKKEEKVRPCWLKDKEVKALMEANDLPERIFNYKIMLKPNIRTNKLDIYVRQWWRRQQTAFSY